MSLYPNWLIIEGRRYKPETAPAKLARVVWDDENPDYQYKSRTLTNPNMDDTYNPPAVMRFYPEMREQSGDYRVNLSTPYDWKPAIIHVNGDDEQKFYYLTGSARATYNQTGWPMQAYITFSGNFLQGEIMGNWFRFVTLKPADLERARGMTINSHPQFVHKFTCVTYDPKTRTTKHIESSGTPRGQVLFYLVTKEGVAYIPRRHVVMP